MSAAPTGRVRIATRKSQLALWQAEHVAALLRGAHTGLEVELVPMSTKGDRIQDRSLAAIGGKGLFIKELETALEDDLADIAVHSMKDVPGELPAGLLIEAVLARADPRDALLSSQVKRLEDLQARRAHRHVESAAPGPALGRAARPSYRSAARQRRHPAAAPRPGRTGRHHPGVRGVWSGSVGNRASARVSIRASVCRPWRKASSASNAARKTPARARSSGRSTTPARASPWMRNAHSPRDSGEAVNRRSRPTRRSTMMC